MAEEMETDPYHGDSTSKTPEPEPQEAEEVRDILLSFWVIAY